MSKEKLVIMVTHDIENARKYADKIIEMSNGTILSEELPYVEETNILKTKNNIEILMN